MNNIPTLISLYNLYLAEYEAKLNITIPLFGKSFLRGLAMANAAVTWSGYLRMTIIQKNTWVDTADSVDNGGTLERFGNIKLGRFPYPSTQGKYKCSVIGNVGAVIQSGTQFISNDDALNPSKLFILDTTYTCTGVTDEIILRAVIVTGKQ